MTQSKRLLIAITFILIAAISGKSQEVTSNILTRVFLIKYGDKFGSSFTIEVQNRQYLITARHVVDGIKDGDTIQILQNEEWKTIAIKALYTQPSEIDIVVLVLPIQISPAFPLEPSMANLIISQNMYFLGFPYGLRIEGRTVNNGFPLPFVKRGICSAIYFSQEKKYNMFFVDGLNNIGFSGGPIVFVDQYSKALKVAGVVSGYRAQEDKVMRKGDKTKGEKEEWVETDQMVRTSSGIVTGYSIQSAVDVILKNPIGPIVK